LAQEGHQVDVFEAQEDLGGGTKSSDLFSLGLIHDHCSAVHPIGVSSPFFRSLELEDHGLRWKNPEVAVAHPLKPGHAAVMYEDILKTAEGLGRDASKWIKLFAPLVSNFDGVASEFLRPIIHVPTRPSLFLATGIRAGLPATSVAALFSTMEAKSLYMGVAAHLVAPLTRPTSASVGIMMTAAGHRNGWPVAEGGSSRISNALVQVASGLGVKFHTNSPITQENQLQGHEYRMFDTSIPQVARILRDRLPRRTLKALHKFRYGPGAFKLDLAVRDGIPWLHEPSRRAGTIHLGGSSAEIVKSESQVWKGDMPLNPFTLIGQQSVADSTRGTGGIHPIWIYAHVPAKHPRADSDRLLEAILLRIESHAPGFMELIVACRATSASQLETENENYVDGDIVGGANSPMQLIFRPSLTLASPYDLGTGRDFICSASTPPGAGVHGLCGYHAANTLISHIRNR
jgi:phytoene dehydrogenase-like protein